MAKKKRGKSARESQQTTHIQSGKRGERNTPTFANGREGGKGQGNSPSEGK